METDAPTPDQVRIPQSKLFWKCAERSLMLVQNGPVPGRIDKWRTMKHHHANHFFLRTRCPSSIRWGNRAGNNHSVSVLHEIFFCEVAVVKIHPGRYYPSGSHPKTPNLTENPLFGRRHPVTRYLFSPMLLPLWGQNSIFSRKQNLPVLDPHDTGKFFARGWLLATVNLQD